MNRVLLKPLLLLTIVLVAPLVTLAFWGEPFAAQVDRWRNNPPSRSTTTILVVAILASDVFLPAPSGPVSTLAGSQLGAARGTLASTIGMTLGAAIAFALARRWGRPLAERLSSPQQVAEAESACRVHGPWVLVLTRPLPVVAEASALLTGALQLSWQRFLPPVILSNLIIAACYSIVGDRSRQSGWLPIALCASVALPVWGAWLWTRRIRGAPKSGERVSRKP